MTRVDCLPITPPSIGTEVFDAVSADCKIYVPDGTYDAYVNAEGWADYKHLIVKPESTVQSQILYTSTDGAIVTPYNTSHCSIVPGLCVTTINCVVSSNSRIYFANRSTFPWSNAASTSSKIHKGTGLTFKIANNTQMAINAFSPPENKRIFCTWK
mgnify:CR=1 FL=1